MQIELVVYTTQIPTLWRWKEADIAKARKVKAAQKPGPKPSARQG